MDEVPGRIAKEMMFTSIIITHWSMNDNRSKWLRDSLNSLFENTEEPFELIVVDNGGNKEDSVYLLDLAEKGKINTYIKNANNMHFGYARTQGLRLANGDYLCVADNDILYEKGWLRACLDILEAYPEEKIYASPRCDGYHRSRQFWSGELKLGDKVYRKNMRAGSNCFVIRREDMVKIGAFAPHRVAGSKWTDRAVKLGYLCAVAYTTLAKDIGYKRGYNLNDSKPVRLTLSNGKELFFNIDEFRKVNLDKIYIEQKNFP